MDGVIGRRSTVTRWLVKLSGVLPILLVALTVISPASAAEEHPIAVIYPDIGEPYRQIFTEIISGIEDKLGAPVASYAVNADTNISVLKTSLNLENTKVVIALGRQGMQAAKQLNNRIKVVVGGVLTVPENDSDDQPVISLTPDPALLFARMKALMPSMKRVFVVYDPSFDTWLMKLAGPRMPRVWNWCRTRRRICARRSNITSKSSRGQTAAAMRCGCRRIPPRWRKVRFFLWCCRIRGIITLRYSPAILATSSAACCFHFILITRAWEKGSRFWRRIC